MDARYKLGHKPGRRRRTRVLIILLVTFVILGIAAGLVALDLRNNQGEPASTKGRTVIQASDEQVDKLSINEPTFQMELPGDWKETQRINTATEKSITWNATRKPEDKRYLKMYIDTIPKDRAINRLLPITVQGPSLSIGDISDNCATFTLGGTLNAQEAQLLKNTAAKWQKVDFICNLPRVTDNEVGTGSPEGINTFTVKGSKGSHAYFFVYTEHNIQPNYSIFYSALRSFRAK